MRVMPIMHTTVSSHTGPPAAEEGYSYPRSVLMRSNQRVSRYLGR